MASPFPAQYHVHAPATAGGLKPLYVRLALAFREAFSEQFLDALKNPDGAFFSITVEQFDRFAVDYGFALATAAGTVDPVTHTGLVHQRNKFRTVINRAGDEGAHGSPRFRINVQAHGKMLRTDLFDPGQTVPADAMSGLEAMVRSLTRMTADIQFMSAVVSELPPKTLKAAQAVRNEVSKYVSNTIVDEKMLVDLAAMENFISHRALIVARYAKQEKAKP